MATILVGCLFVLALYGLFIAPEINKR